MQGFSIQAVKGTNRIRIVDALSGASEEVVASEAMVARFANASAKAMSFAVPHEVPSMKVCAFGR